MFATFISSPVWAQSTDNAAVAEALFQEAQKLISIGKLSEACPKFVESDRLDPGLGTKLSIADCYERDGKLAKAWAMFSEIIPLAKQAGRKDREAIAKKRADALEPRVPKLIVVLTGADPSKVQVARDGVVLGSATFGVPLPIDPGKHVITAQAAGFKEWKTEVDVEEGKTLEVKVSALEVDDAKPPPPPPPPVALPAAGRGLKVAGAVVGGLGLVGIGVGTWFGLKTFSDWEQAQKLCGETTPPYTCDEKGQTAADSARTSGNVSTGLFIGGGIALAAGVGMMVVGFRGNATPSKTGIRWIVPTFDGKSTGLVLQGQF